MPKINPQRFDPKSWREKAARFRACAQMTREAERQRVFPALADECESVAKELERRTGQKD
jgi:hypothetical protein